VKPESIGQVGVLLGSLGFALQWARAQVAFPEWGYYAVAAVLTAFGVFLATDGAVTDWKSFLLTNWPVVVTLFGAVTGGNQLASSAAKAAVKAGANENNMLIPLTDSKGTPKGDS